MCLMNSASVPCLTDASELRRPEPTARIEAVHAPAWPVALCGVPFDNVTIADTLARIDAMIANGRPHYVVTANVDFLVQAHRDVELRRILIEADLVLCDGTPLLWASRWFGNPLPERVAGSDLAPAMIAHAAERGHRIFLLGAALGVAAEAAGRLLEQHPTLKLVGHYAPPFSALLEMDHAEIARRIREAKPDILLVSFGCPKQEKWIAMHYRALGVPVAIGVGATIDFLAGRVKRAPAWMRRTGTEWLYRLLQEPRRLYRRYANDLTYFLPVLALQWRRLRPRAAHAATGRPPLTVAANWCHVEFGAEFTRRTLQRDAEFWSVLPQRSGHCLCDLGKIERVDSTGVAYLVRWRRELQARGHQLVLLAPARPLRDALATLRLNDYFPVADDAAEALRLVESTHAQSPVLHDSTARTLAWCGEIIAANVDDVWQLTTDHVRTFVAQRTHLVIIDLSRLRFIDSAGAGLMLRIKKWAQQLPAEVIFTHAQPNVRNVLRLTRLDQLLLEGAQ
jgi:N-acetylglucosaminyldiphosphoundecaprenol N-acetyl-beta-D-mannosaminyltransferase